MSTKWTVLETAHQALRTAIAGVGADGWQRPTPCDQWTVTQVLQHASGDQLAYASAITGEAGPAENPFAPSGVLDEDPAAVAEKSLTASAAAFATVQPGAQDVPKPLPLGPMTAELVVAAAALRRKRALGCELSDRPPATTWAKPNRSHPQGSRSPKPCGFALPSFTTPMGAPARAHGFLICRAVRGLRRGRVVRLRRTARRASRGRRPCPAPEPPR